MKILRFEKINEMKSVATQLVGKEIRHEVLAQGPREVIPLQVIQLLKGQFRNIINNFMFTNLMIDVKWAGI